MLANLPYTYQSTKHCKQKKILVFTNSESIWLGILVNNPNQIDTLFVKRRCYIIYSMFGRLMSMENWPAGAVQTVALAMRSESANGGEEEHFAGEAGVDVVRVLFEL